MILHGMIDFIPCVDHPHMLWYVNSFLSCVEFFSGQVALVDLDSIYLSLLGDRNIVPTTAAVESAFAKEPSIVLLITFNTSDTYT